MAQKNQPVIKHPVAATPTFISLFCDKFIEAGWLAAIFLSAFYMNIYTHRMFEPDKACLIRSIAFLMLVAWLIKKLELRNVMRSPQASISHQSRIGANNLILLPIFLYIGSYVLSTITSATPYPSFWGSYDRLEGLYTYSAYFVIAFLAMTHIKERAQIERLITTVILTSIPIFAYSFIQRLGLDPVPWQAMSPVTRVSSTMGNPIFYAAYLIMIIPLTLSRFIKSLWHFMDKYETKVFFEAFFYSLVLVFQSISVLLTQSRGPFLGLGVGILGYALILGILHVRQPWKSLGKAIIKTISIALCLGIILLIISPFHKLLELKILSLVVALGSLFLFLVVFIYFTILLVKKRWEWFLQSVIISALLGIIFVVAFNLHQPMFKSVRERVPYAKKIVHALAPLEQTPYLGRFAHMFEPQLGSGRVRLIIWEGAMNLVTDSTWRFIVGYGPESLHVVYYKYFTMELAGLEGSTTHADRCHNAVLDAFVHQGVIGLFTYLLLWAGFFYLGLKTLWKVVRESSNGWDLILIGLITGGLAHLGESLIGIEIVVTNTHFWLYFASLYAISRITGYTEKEIVTSSDSGRPQVLPLQPKKSKKATKSKTQDDVKDVTPNFNLGFYLFWVYTAVTLTAVYIIITMYWPNERSNIDGWIIGTYLWVLLGVVLGATSISRKNILQKSSSKRVIQVQFKLRFSNFINYSLMLIIVFIVIAKSNLSIIRADGFYKFCFSLDVAAESVVKNPTRLSQQERLKNAYMIRINSIPFYQKALLLAPHEKVYLNGAGRNFLELVKYRESLERAKILPQHPRLLQSAAMEGILHLDPTNALEKIEKARVEKAVNEILLLPIEQWNKFSRQDLFLCCYAVIMRSYQLDPTNLERIVALARVFRFWGQVERDKTKFEMALKAYQLAKAASPFNTSILKEEEDTMRSLGQFK
ncbi:O-antigen ligase family protein [Planctomycetota bacterium]